MKNLIKPLSVYVLTLFVATDDAPNDLFMETYEGYISYSSNSENKSVGEGSITVVKVVNKYNFDFPDDIPNINEVKLKMIMTISTSTSVIARSIIFASTRII